MIAVLPTSCDGNEGHGSQQKCASSHRAIHFWYGLPLDGNHWLWFLNVATWSHILLLVIAHWSYQPGGWVCDWASAVMLKFITGSRYSAGRLSTLPYIPASWPQLYFFSPLQFSTPASVLNEWMSLNVSGIHITLQRVLFFLQAEIHIYMEVI